MIGGQGVIKAINDMQYNAQTSLPVTPNNGNPMGANNMPAADAQPPQEKSPYFYPWLAPSPYMDQIKQRLAQYGNTQPQSMAQPGTTVVPQAMPQQQQQMPATMPVLPNAVY